MIIRPSLNSHSYRGPIDALGYSALDIMHGTIFDGIALKCDWSVDDECYYIEKVAFSFRPARVTTNFYAPWDKNEDRRFREKVLEIDFRMFCNLVADGLRLVSQLQRICEIAPEGAEVELELSGKFCARLEGMFLLNWPHAPIFQNDKRSQKAAALAVLELLELEACLPSERI